MSQQVSLASKFLSFSGLARKKKNPPWKWQHLNSSSQLSLTFSCPRAFSVTALVVGSGVVELPVEVRAAASRGSQCWYYWHWVVSTITSSKLAADSEDCVFPLFSQPSINILKMCCQHRAHVNSLFFNKGKYSCQLTMLLAWLDRTSDVSDRTSPKFNFLSTGQEKTTTKLCIRMKLKVKIILYIKIKLYVI